MKVEQIRESRGRFYLSGAGNGIRICLLTGVELLTAEAGNSLLKVLEEPPGGLCFLLTSPQPGRVLPTIVSRCRRYHVAPLAGHEIEQVLREAGAVPEAVGLNLVVSLSGGLPGKALALAVDPDLPECLQAAAGLAVMCGGAMTDDGADLLQVAATLADRPDMPYILELLCLSFRDRLVWSLTSDPNLLINTGRWEGLPVLPDGCLQESLEIVKETIQVLNTTSANRRLALESLLIVLRRRAERCRK